MSPDVSVSITAFAPEGPAAVLDAPPGVIARLALPRSTSIMLIEPIASIDAEL